MTMINHLKRKPVRNCKIRLSAWPATARIVLIVQTRRKYSFRHNGGANLNATKIVMFKIRWHTRTKYGPLKTDHKRKIETTCKVQVMQNATRISLKIASSLHNRGRLSFSRTATHKYLIGHLTIGALCARTLYFRWTHATALIRHKLDELTLYDAVFSRTRLLREQTAFRIQANTYPAEFVDHISRPAVGPDYRTPRCFGAIRPSPGNNNKQSSGRR